MNSTLARVCVDSEEIMLRGHRLSEFNPDQGVCGQSGDHVERS